MRIFLADVFAEVFAEVAWENVRWEIMEMSRKCLGYDETRYILALNRLFLDFIIPLIQGHKIFAHIHFLISNHKRRSLLISDRFHRPAG